MFLSVLSALVVYEITCKFYFLRMEFSTNNPAIADINEAAKMPILATCTIVSSAKARPDMKIDIVKPIPASNPTP